MKQLTAGEWEVDDVIGFDDKGTNLYFTQLIQLHLNAISIA